MTRPVTPIRCVLTALLAAGLFITAAFGETWLRQTHTTALPINGLPIDGVKASATHTPDFLWQGDAWWIEIETDKPLLLRLDNWSGHIPAGSHKVYSNHDHTNTGQYGGQQSWGLPETVIVQAVVP